MGTGDFGYGRYDSDPNHVGCPRAQSDMTPCIARDGSVALADNSACVGCGFSPKVLLDEIAEELHVTYAARTPIQRANKLKEVVRELTEDLVK